MSRQKSLIVINGWMFVFSSGLALALILFVIFGRCPEPKPCPTVVSQVIEGCDNGQLCVVRTLNIEEVVEIVEDYLDKEGAKP